MLIGLGKMVKKVTSSLNLLASKILGYTLTPISGYSYYTSTVGSAKKVLSIFTSSYAVTGINKYTYFENLDGLGTEVQLPFAIYGAQLPNPVSINDSTYIALGSSTYSQSVLAKTTDSTNWSLPTPSSVYIKNSDIQSVGDVLVVPYSNSVGWAYPNRYNGLAFCTNGETFLENLSWFSYSYADANDAQMYLKKLKNGTLVLLVSYLDVVDNSNRLDIYTSTDGTYWPQQTYAQQTTAYISNVVQHGDAISFDDQAKKYILSLSGQSLQSSTTVQGYKVYSNVNMLVATHQLNGMGDTYVSTDAGYSWTQANISVYGGPSGINAYNLKISDSEVAGYGWLVSFQHVESYNYNNSYQSYDNEYYIGYMYPYSLGGSNLALGILGQLPNQEQNGGYEIKSYRHDILSTELAESLSGKLVSGREYYGSQLPDTNPNIGAIFFTQMSAQDGLINVYSYPTADTFNFSAITLVARLQPHDALEIHEQTLSTLSEVQVAIGGQGTDGTAETLAPIDVYTVPAINTATIDKVTIKNTSSAAISFDYGVYNSGETMTDANATLNDYVLNAGQTYEISNIVSPLTQNQRIVVFPSSVDTVEAKVYGTETEMTPIYQYTISTSPSAPYGGPYNVNWGYEQKHFIYIPLTETIPSSIVTFGNAFGGSGTFGWHRSTVYVDGVAYEYFSGADESSILLQTEFISPDGFTVNSDVEALAASLIGKTIKFY